MNAMILKSNNKILNKKFFKYTVPSVVAMWVSALFIMVDAMFVSRGVGPEALAAVNIAMPYTNFVFAISILFTMGSSTIVSIALGEGNKDKASKYFSMNFFALTCIAIILCTLSFLFLNDIAIFLGSTKTTLPIVKKYLKVIIMFNFFYLLTYALEVLVKADGFPYLSIIGTVISAFTNIILDYIFVIKLGYGVEGAAFATGIARALSFIFFLIHFLSKKSTLKFVKFKFEFNFLKRVSSIGFSECITELSMGIVILLFNQFISKYIGENALISYSVMAYISTLVLSTMMGISQGLQPLCSYYIGMKDKDTIKYLFTLSLKIVLLVSLFILGICLFFTDNIILLFIDKSDMNLFNYTRYTFRIFSISFLVLGFNVVTSGFLASLEKAKEACTISLSRGLFVVSLSLVLCVFIFGGGAIWYATLFSEIVVIFMSIFIVRKTLKEIDLNNSFKDSTQSNLGTV